MNSRSLVRGPEVMLRPPLTRAMVDDEALDRFLAGRNERRVGRYFEHLVHFWLAHVRGFDVEGVGIPLRSGNRTIGELDFVYRADDGDRVHCEVAVKFFLHLPGAAESEYPGPNPSDSFERKIRRLFHHQLPISREYHDRIDRREVLVDGMIFHHIDGHDSGDPPERLAPDHARGRWFRIGELDRFVEQLGGGQSGEQLLATTVPKPFWLAPRLHVEPMDQQRIRQQLTAHFRSGPGHPLMLSRRSHETMPGVEAERLFVVSDDWPQGPARR